MNADDQLLQDTVQNGCMDDLKDLLVTHQFSDDQITNTFIMVARQQNIDAVNILLPHIKHQDLKDHVLWEAAYYGYSDMVALVLPWSATVTKHFNPLQAAVSSGHTECVRILVDATDNIEHITEACRRAINQRYSNMDIVRLLLPKTDPKKDNCILLCTAVDNYNEEAFDLLYPLSDPNIALQELRNKGHTGNIGMLTTRIKADEEHQILQNALTCEKPSFKNKKI